MPKLTIRPSTDRQWQWGYRGKGGRAPTLDAVRQDISREFNPGKIHNLEMTGQPSARQVNTGEDQATPNIWHKMPKKEAAYWVKKNQEAVDQGRSPIFNQDQLAWLKNRMPKKSARTNEAKAPKQAQAEKDRIAAQIRRNEARLAELEKLLANGK